IQGGLAGTAPDGHPVVWSQAHGAWERDERGRFSFTTITLVTDLTGVLVRVKDRGVLEMNPAHDVLTGREFREFILPDKTVVFSLYLDTRLTRLKVEPMP